MDNTNELLRLVFVNQKPFGCNTLINCPNKERTLSFALGVSIPTPGQNPEEVFKECCYFHYVFADANSSEDFKNDYSSFFHQRQLPNETVEFVLVDLQSGSEFVLDDNTFGSHFAFGSFDENPNLSGYLVMWKNVLSEIGTGSYQIVKRIVIAGVPVEFPSIVFTLRQFSSKVADRTTRIDVVMNGRLEKTGVDFTGISWKHSIRVPGFFGRREAQFEEDNIVNRQFEKRQVSMKQTNEFTFQSKLIPECLTNEIMDFFLFANDIFFNDYNLNNHSYNFVKFGVKFASNDGTEYGTQHRKARLNLTFNDKFDNNIKRNFR